MRGSISLPLLCLSIYIFRLLSLTRELFLLTGGSIWETSRRDVVTVKYVMYGNRTGPITAVRVDDGERERERVYWEGERDGHITYLNYIPLLLPLSLRLSLSLSVC